MRRRAFLSWLGLAPVFGPDALKTLKTLPPLGPTVATADALTLDLIDVAIAAAKATEPQLYPITINGREWYILMRSEPHYRR